VSKRRAAIATTSRRPVAGERSLSLDGNIIANLRDKQEEINQRATQIGHLLHVTHDTKQRVNLLMHIDDLKLAFARVEQQISALQPIIVPTQIAAVEFA
jgi:Tfp pilus assembly ATPase PilU